MSGNADDPESTIPWPGFVDILSTVLIVFVFFMMMTSVIIFVLSEEVKKKAVEQARSETIAQVMAQQLDPQTQPQAHTSMTLKTSIGAETTKSAATKNESTADLAALLKENEEMKRKIALFSQMKGIVSESNQQSVQKSVSGMTIVFGDFGATLTKETIRQIEDRLPFKGKILVRAAVPNSTTFSATQEIALGRGLNVRNVFLQNNINPKKITMKIVSQKKEEMESEYGIVYIEFNE